MKLLQIDKEHAFSELYSRYRVPLYTYFYGLIGSTLAEELMQDTFIKRNGKAFHLATIWIGHGM